MNTKMNPTTLSRNHTSGNQPSLIQSTRENGKGACQPPRNSVTASAETVIMLMYSARKNIANFSDEYSVWKPPTSSPSASGRSNGARLGSPTARTMEIRNELGTAAMNQRPCCESTTSDVDIDWAKMKTATRD